MTIAVVFPGQGTQQPGMATPWRDHPAWAVIEQAEAALHEPLAHLITDAPAEALARTREAQLAVLLTSLVAWTALEPLPDAPVAFAGHSLGQVTALIASGVLSLEAGVRFAARRAELTQAAADAHPGRMAALLGATIEQAEEACAAAPDGCWVANDNAPGQVVIAGTPEGPRGRIRPSAGARCTPGHAVERRRGVPHATHARGHRRPRAGGRRSPARGSERAGRLQPRRGRLRRRRRLARPPPRHVSVPVRWRSTMDTLVGLGATTFVEIGHGSMLAALAKRGAPSVTVRNVATPDDIDLQLPKLNVEVA